MFWWYWSLRQRLMLLVAVLLPFGGFFAFRVLLDGDVSSTSPESAPSTVAGALPEAAAPKSEMLVLADGDARSAARVFPAAFGDFGEGSVQTRNMVFPGMASDEYSVYLFFRSVSAAAPAAPTTAVPPSAEGSTSSSVPATTAGTTAETVRESLRWQFTDRGAATRVIESRSGAELFVAGLEGSRGYRTTLRFQEVPGGVVVRGVVKEVPANEVNDLVAESQPPSGDPSVDPAADPGEEGGAPASTSPTTVP